MTQYKGSKTAGQRGAFAQAFGNAWCGDDAATPAAALATTDTIDLIRIPRGVRLTELFKTNGDFDTGTTLQYKLGFRKVDSGGALADNDAYFAAAGATDLQAAVTGAAPTRYAFAPITFDEDVFITLTPTANATGVSGTPTITVYARGEMVGGK
jgi:hypothetical protein